MNHYSYAMSNPVQFYDPLGLFLPLIVLGYAAAALMGKAVIGAAIGASVEIGIQVGKEVVGQIKDNWDNDHDLFDIDLSCIDINWKHVGVSAGIGTIAPGLGGTAKAIWNSGKAIRTMSGQPATSSNQQMIGQHKEIIYGQVIGQAGWQSLKYTLKCGTQEKKNKCRRQKE